MPAVAGKVAEALPAATVTGVATRRAKLFALRETAAPPEGAALESVTVHVLLAPELRLVGVQASEATLIGATKEIDADAEAEL